MTALERVTTALTDNGWDFEVEHGQRKYVRSRKRPHYREGLTKVTAIAGYYTLVVWFSPTGNFMGRDIRQQGYNVSGYATTLGDVISEVIEKQGPVHTAAREQRRVEREKAERERQAAAAARIERLQTEVDRRLVERLATFLTTAAGGAPTCDVRSPHNARVVAERILESGVLTAPMTFEFEEEETTVTSSIVTGRIAALSRVNA